MMMKVTTLSALILSFVLFATKASAQDSLVRKSLHPITVMDIDGKPVSLADYRGKVLLIVNVASYCGYTPQYAGLQDLYLKYKDRGLVVLGFPANNFAEQEPDPNEKIKEFCSTKFNVTFPMFSKVSVKGADQHPLYKFLTDKNENGVNGDPVKWNFQKFLIAKDGSLITTFLPVVKPENGDLRKEIEKALMAPNP